MRAKPLPAIVYRVRVTWKWQKRSDLAAALRWPWDHCTDGRYAAQNDNDLIYTTTAKGGLWSIHRLDLAKGKR